MYRGELFNSITHLVGSVMAVVGTTVLLTTAVLTQAGARRITALSVYGAMLIVLYLSSTLYHSLRGKAKQLFHVFDHCAIYLLIAGTYTPFTLVTLRGPWGWTLFAIIWTLAALGVAKDIFLPGRYKILSVILYLLMGWLVVVAFVPLRAALPVDGIRWIVAGGLIYTAGVVFFALSKRVLHTHGLWHLCVMAGSVCHYVVVYRYVA
ncbi:MAG: hemolysin III family protein [Acidobacteriota bacterium]